MSVCTAPVNGREIHGIGELSRSHLKFDNLLSQLRQSVSIEVDTLFSRQFDLLHISPPQVSISHVIWSANKLLTLAKRPWPERCQVEGDFGRKQGLKNLLLPKRPLMGSPSGQNSCTWWDLWSRKISLTLFYLFIDLKNMPSARILTGWAAHRRPFRQ